MRYHGTNIDGISIEPEGLHVRGLNLNEMIGSVSYLASIFHIICGKVATTSQVAYLNKLFCGFFTEIISDHETLKYIIETRLRFQEPTTALVISLLSFEGKLVKSHWLVEMQEKLNISSNKSEGLLICALVPFLLGVLTSPWQVKTLAQFATCLDENRPFTEIVLYLLNTEKDYSPKEITLFDDMLVSLHGGFGFLTPTVLAPRVVASTRGKLLYAVTAGLLASGPAHVGACSDTMKLLQNIAANNTCSTEESIEQVLIDYKESNLKLPGFGHPLFIEDPRVPRIRERLTQLNIDSIYLDIFDRLVIKMYDKFGTKPNVDSIAAVVYLILELKSTSGTGLFLASRTAAMVAHTIEKYARPAFGARSAIARQKVMNLQVGWL